MSIWCILQYSSKPWQLLKWWTSLLQYNFKKLINTLKLFYNLLQKSIHATSHEFFFFSFNQETVYHPPEMSTTQPKKAKGSGQIPALYYRSSTVMLKTGDKLLHLWEKLTSIPQWMAKKMNQYICDKSVFLPVMKWYTCNKPYNFF